MWKDDFNVYSMCIQCEFKNIVSSSSQYFSEFNKTMDYNGGARSAWSEKHDFDIYSMCIQDYIKLLKLTLLIFQWDNGW